MMIIRDNCSRFTIMMHFLRSKDGIAKYFTEYLVDIAPSIAEMVRSDGGREFKGEFLALCTSEKVK